MPAFIQIIQSVARDSFGLRLLPGVLQSFILERPALRKMIHGSRLELRRPDGTSMRTTLLQMGIAVTRGAGGELFMGGSPEEQPLMLTVPSGVSEADVPPGTELWLLEPGRR